MHVQGFGSRVVAFDIKENPELKKLGVEYGELDWVLKQSGAHGMTQPLRRFFAKELRLRGNV